MSDAKNSVKAELVAKINDALANINVPDSLTPARAEYFKAGARACILAVRAAIKESQP